MSGARKGFAGGAGKCTLTGGIDNAVTTMQLTGDVSGWPTGASSRKFVAVIDRLGAAEKVLCTSLSGTGPATVVIATRGFDGTVAVAHSVGVTVEHCVDADTLDDYGAHTYDVVRDDHTQYLRTDGSRAPSGLSAMVGNPVSVGTANNGGAASTLARSDHVHNLGAGAVDALSKLASPILDLVEQLATARLLVPMAVVGASSKLSSDNTVTDFGNSQSVTIPSWATRAIVRTDWSNVDRVNGGAAAGGYACQVRTNLAGFAGSWHGIETSGVTSSGFNTAHLTYSDIFGGLTPGIVTLKTQAQGDGIGHSSDGLKWTSANFANGVAFDVEFLP